MLRYLEQYHVHELQKAEAFELTGLTSDHYSFVYKQVCLHADHVERHRIYTLDQRRAQQQKAIQQLKLAIE
jgi:hypothetical protein